MGLDGGANVLIGGSVCRATKATPARKVAPFGSVMVFS